MRKEVVEINGKQVTIMEQPATFTLDLERKFGNKRDLVEYCQEILKYPAGINRPLEEILNIPEEVIFEEMKLSLIKDGKKDLRTALRLFISISGENGESNAAYVAETFIKEVKEDVNTFKYSKLTEMGAEIFKQVGDIGHLLTIRNIFRNL